MALWRGGLSHPVDLLRWYLPDIAEVMGYSSLSQNGRALGLKNPDTFQFIYKSAHGIPARVSGTYTSPVIPCERDSNMSCTLRCANGASQGDYATICVTPGKNRCTKSIMSRRSRTRTIIISASAVIRITRVNTRNLHRIFRALSFQKENAEARRARSASSAVALMQAMEESCAKGLPVKTQGRRSPVINSRIC